MTNRKLKGKRLRAITVSGALVAILVWVAMIPVPLSTVVEGVVWADPDSRVRMDSRGSSSRCWCKPATRSPPASR
ncbi:MAG: hypothetical protein M5U09_14810 [Gammaproteobacteria bacterium]|nr:hypothetical protein [Gammaproteobacteria bacterium]